MEIKVLFFGILTDIAKTGFKHYRNVTSFNDLKHKIEDDYPEFVHFSYRIAVNNEIINEEPVLKDGDRVAFMPPFTGG
jgi:molybdopterin synthase sulfur carrier subunit